MIELLMSVLPLLIALATAQPSPLTCPLEVGANCRDQYYDLRTDRCIECTTCRYEPANIIFVLDRSSSITFPEFELAKQFLANAVRELNTTVTEVDAAESTTIGGEGIRIGAIRVLVCFLCRFQACRVVGSR